MKETKYNHIIIEFNSGDFIIETLKKPHTLQYCRMKAAQAARPYLEKYGYEVETLTYTNDVSKTLYGID